eukprot:g2261.t1
MTSVVQSCASLRRRPALAIGAAVVLMAIFAGSGIPTAYTETSISELWIETDGRVRSELDYRAKHRSGGGVGDVSSHIVLTVNKGNDQSSVLTAAQLLEQVAVQKAVADINVTVPIGPDRTPTTFYTNDLCVAPTPYQSPCTRLTVTDCFADGAVDLPQHHHDYLLGRIAGLALDSMVDVFEEIALGALNGDPLGRLKQNNTAKYLRMCRYVAPQQFTATDMGSACTPATPEMKARGVASVAVNALIAPPLGKVFTLTEKAAKLLDYQLNQGDPVAWATKTLQQKSEKLLVLQMAGGLAQGYAKTLASALDAERKAVLFNITAPLTGGAAVTNYAASFIGAVAIYASSASVYDGVYNATRDTLAASQAAYDAALQSTKAATALQMGASADAALQAKLVPHLIASGVTPVVTGASVYESATAAQRAAALSIVAQTTVPVGSTYTATFDAIKGEKQTAMYDEALTRVCMAQIGNGPVSDFSYASFKAQVAQSTTVQAVALGKAATDLVSAPPGQSLNNTPAAQKGALLATFAINTATAKDTTELQAKALAALAVDASTSTTDTCSKVFTLTEKAAKLLDYQLNQGDPVAWATKTLQQKSEKLLVLQMAGGLAQGYAKTLASALDAERKAVLFNITAPLTGGAAVTNYAASFIGAVAIYASSASVYDGVYNATRDTLAASQAAYDAALQSTKAATALQMGASADAALQAKLVPHLIASGVTPVVTGASVYESATAAQRAAALSIVAQTTVPVGSAYTATFDAIKGGVQVEFFNARKAAVITAQGAAWGANEAEFAKHSKSVADTTAELFGSNPQKALESEGLKPFLRLTGAADSGFKGLYDSANQTQKSTALLSFQVDAALNDTDQCRAQFPGHCLATATTAQKEAALGAIVPNSTAGRYDLVFKSTVAAYDTGGYAAALAATVVNDKGAVATLVNRNAINRFAKTFYEAKFYNARPKLSTASQDTILDAATGECRMWDDPEILDALPVAKKQLYVGGETWNTSVPKQGWAHIAKMNPDHPQGWRRDADNSKLAGATTTSQVHLTITPKALKNRLIGLNAYGEPLDVELKKWCREILVGDVSHPDCRNSEPLVEKYLGADVSTRFSRHGGQVHITLKEAEHVIVAWQKAFDGLQLSPALASNTLTQAHFMSSGRFTRDLAKYGRGQAGLLVLGFVAMIAYTVLALTYTGGARIGAAGALGVLLVAGSLAACYGLSALFGVSYNTTTIQVLPFLLLAIGVNDMYVVTHAAIAARGAAANRDAWMSATLGEAGPSITVTSACNFVVFLMIRVVKMPVVVDFGTTAAIGVVTMYLTNILVWPCVLVLTWQDSGGKGGGDKRQCAVVRFDRLLSSRAAQVAVLAVLFGGIWGASMGGVGEMKVGLNQADVVKDGTPLQKTLHYFLSQFSFQPGAVNARRYDYAPPANQLRYYALSERIARLPMVLQPNEVWMHPFFVWMNQTKPYVKCKNSKCTLPTYPNTPNAIDLTVGGPGEIASDKHGIQPTCQGSNLLTDGECGPKFHCTFGWVEAGKNGVPYLREPGSTSDGLDFLDFSGRHAALSDPNNTRPFCVRLALGQTLGAAQAGKGRDWCMALPSERVPSTGFDADATYTRTGFYPTAPTDTMRQCLPAFINNTVVTTNPRMKFTVEPKPDSTIPGANRTREYVHWEGDAGAVSEFSLFGFYANGLVDDSNYVELIKSTRGVLEAAKPDGIKVDARQFFPSGIPFVFWEQYIGLKDRVLQNCAVTAVAVFLMLGATLFFTSNLADRASAAARAGWMALLSTLVCVLITCELYGYMAWADIKLSAIPATTLWVSASMGVEYTVHIVYAYCQSTRPTQWERTTEAFDRMFVPTLNGAVSTLVGVLPLAATDFEFIKKYYLVPFVLLAVFAGINAVMLLPALMSLLGSPSLRESSTSDADRTTPGTWGGDKVKVMPQKIDAAEVATDGDAATVEL